MKQVLKLTLEDTKKMMDGAINKAIELGIDTVSYTHLTLPTN